MPQIVFKQATHQQCRHRLPAQVGWPAEYVQLWALSHHSKPKNNCILHDIPSHHLYQNTAVEMHNMSVIQDLRSSSW